MTIHRSPEPLDLDALEALRRGANDLPWWVVELNESDDGFDGGIMSEHVAITDGCIHGEIRPSDARYAVAAANAVPHLIARIRELEAKVAELSSRPTYDDGLMAAGVDVLRRAAGPWTPANGSSRQAAMLLAQDLNRSDAEGLARVLVQLRIGVDPTMPPRGEKARRLAVIECLIAAQNEERCRV